MIHSKTKLDFILIFSEACLLLLIYLFIVGVFELTPLINPTYYFILAAVLTFVNLYLSGGPVRRLTIAIVNILLVAIGAAFITGQADFILFSPPTETSHAANYVLVYISILWLACRSLYLVFKGEIDFYAHMDFHFAITLGILLLADSAQISLPKAMYWLVATIFFNFLPLFIFYNTEKMKNWLSWLLLILTAFIILGLSAGTATLLPHLTGTAGTVLDILKPIAILILRILIAPLVFWLKLLNLIPKSNLADTQPLPEQDISYVSPQPTPSDSILLYIGWVFVAVLILITVLFLIYLLSFLISWLWQQQEEGYRRPSFRSFWREILLSFLKQVQKIGSLLSLCTPGSLSPYRAYLYLLRWGSSRGCPRQNQETPGEYCKRLIKRHPQHRLELQKITGHYIEWRYSGETHLIEQNLKPIVLKLYKPVFSRFKRKPPFQADA